MENDETGDEPSHTFQMKKSHQKQEHKNNPIRKNAPRRKNIIFGLRNLPEKYLLHQSVITLV